jgi:hypothetical protein
MGNALRQARPVETNALLSPAPASYLSPPDPVPTADEWVDNGTVCDSKDPHTDLWRHHVDDYCFMSPSQRTRQIIKFEGRVNKAAIAYSNALLEGRVKALLAAKPGGSWVFELLLDAIGLAITPAIARAFKSLRDASVRELAKLVDEPTDAARALLGVSDQSLTTIARQSVTSAKRSVPRPSDPAAHTRDAKLNYLDLLTKQGEAAFQHISEGVLRNSTDADLLVLTEAYDIHNGHSQVDYAGYINKLLDHFEVSGVSHIGVDWNDRVGADHPLEFQKAETKAYLVDFPAGKRLALYRREHAQGLEPGDAVSPLLGGVYRLSDEDSAQLKSRDVEKRPFVFDRFVPEDLVEVAAQFHEATWGSEPTVRSAAGDECVALAGGKR